MSLPEGFGYVPGRSRATAIKLLDSAAEVDADVATAVRTVRDGYHVQDDVLENYNAKLADEDVAIGGDTETETGAGAQPAATETAKSETSGTENATSETENATSGTENATSGTETETSTETETVTNPVQEPAKNASTAAWLEFAKASAGWNEADAELGRNELAEKYGTAEPAE